MRRNNIRLMTSVEKKIHDLIVEIEEMEANVLLTDTQIKLAEAQNKYADYIDELMTQQS